MIVQRTEQDGVINTIYESSNILASAYDTNKKELTITFKNGGQYAYLDVPQTNFTRFETADSQGKIFNTHIKEHKFVKLDKVDTKPILEEVNKVKAAELASFEALMIGQMSEMVDYYNDSTKFSSILMERLLESNKLYEDKKK
tara:strand:+ start:3757 stop:4185 length:429 start_codon:yes stop_codon:yes gene_type:complete